MDHGHQGASQTPLIEPWGTDCTGQGINHDEIVAFWINVTPNIRCSRQLGSQIGGGSYNLLNRDPISAQTREELTVVEVATSEARGVTNRDKRNMHAGA